MPRPERAQEVVGLVTVRVLASQSRPLHPAGRQEARLLALGVSLQHPVANLLRAKWATQPTAVAFSHFTNVKRKNTRPLSHPMRLPCPITHIISTTSALRLAFYSPGSNNRNGFDFSLRHAKVASLCNFSRNSQASSAGILTFDR